MINKYNTRKKYKKCQSIQENIAEYQETINANKEKQKLLEEQHRKSKGILKSLGVYKRARKRVRKPTKKQLTLAMQGISFYHKTETAIKKLKDDPAFAKYFEKHLDKIK